MPYESVGTSETRYMTVPICRQSVRSELSGDYTLPDYHPEIRRLLHVSANVLPPAKYVGGSRVELDGTVDYQILYVGADGELYTAPLTGEYSVAVPLEGGTDIDMGEGVCVMATSRADSISPRVTGPRKLTLRTRLQTEVSAYGKQMLSEHVRGEAAPESICVQYDEARMAEPAVFHGEELTLREVIDGVASDVRVVSADAGALVHDVTSRDGEIGFAGEVRLCLLCAYPDGRMETIRRQLPFEGRMEAEETAGEEMGLRASVYVSELAVHVEEGCLSCDVHLIPEAQRTVNRTLRYQKDLFSTQCPSEIVYGNHTLPVHLRSFCGNLSQSERIALSELSIPEDTKIVSAYGTACFEESECRDGKYVLTGQSRYVLVCERDGEYSTSELTLPLRYTADGGAEAASDFDATVRVVDCRARVSGDTLELDAELSLDGTWLGETRVRPVEEISFGEPLARRSGEMILCYPAPEETLWDVAKRYHVDPGTVSGDPATDPYVIL